MMDGVPAGVPPEAAEAARATLGGALAAAQDISGETGRVLADAARGAFTHAFGLAALVSAAIALIAAVLAATVLGSPRHGAEAHATD
jgi:DHA2 family multidrug resistance protein-like MFS transporter